MFYTSKNGFKVIIFSIEFFNKNMLKTGGVGVGGGGGGVG